jgi:RNA polymerase sigma factor (sigma-70 family)
MRKAMHKDIKGCRDECRTWLGAQVIQRLQLSEIDASDLAEATLDRVEARVGLRRPGNADWNAKALRILKQTYRSLRGRQWERMQQSSSNTSDPQVWQSISASPVDALIAIEEMSERARQGERIRRAFEALPTSTRHILIQVVIRRRTIREVARRLGTPRATTYEHLMAAIGQLHNRYIELLKSEQGSAQTNHTRLQ